MMKSHRITGGGGAQLHLIETGNSSGRPILFIHGTSQCWLNWKRQLSSDLADDFRLVAMDLRGHGLSDKPREGYTDSRLWAEDANSAIRALSQVQVMANTGHAAFWDNADAFNRKLRVFTSSL